MHSGHAPFEEGRLVAVGVEVGAVFDLISFRVVSKKTHYTEPTKKLNGNEPRPRPPPRLPFLPHTVPGCRVPREAFDFSKFMMLRAPLGCVSVCASVGVSGCRPWQVGTGQDRTELVCCLAAHTTRSTIIRGTTTFNNNKMKLYKREGERKSGRKREGRACKFPVCALGQMLNVIKFNARLVLKCPESGQEVTSLVDIEQFDGLH